MWVRPWCSMCTLTISPSSPQLKEIFNPTHQLESMPTGLVQSSSFFIIFTKSEKTTLMSMPFILKELISPWISPSSETHIFLELSFQHSPVDLFSSGSTISSVGARSPYARSLESFTSCSSDVAPLSIALAGRDNFTLF